VHEFHAAHHIFIAAPNVSKYDAHAHKRGRYVTQYFGYDAVLPMNTGAEAGSQRLGAAQKHSASCDNLTQLRLPSKLRANGRPT
jgi:hypothetical protein